MEIQKNWYSKKIDVIIKPKKGEIKDWNASILTYKNNEILILLDQIEKKKDNIIFDAEIEIIVQFNFNNINQDLFWLLLLIYGLKTYRPKSVRLTLPYFPYTHKDIFNEEFTKSIKINTDHSLLTILQNSWIDYINTYDLGNKYIKTYYDIFVEEVSKKDIFTEEFDFFRRTKKRVTIIVLNKEDYNYFKKYVGNKENINIIFIDWDIKKKTKAEKISILSSVKNPDNTLIYIFDKMLIRWAKIYNLIDFLMANLDIKELNLCITHGIFAFWSYIKFNSLMEKYKYLNIVTTDSIYSPYVEKLNKKQTEIYPLWIKEKILSELKNNTDNDEIKE